MGGTKSALDARTIIKHALIRQLDILARHAVVIHWEIGGIKNPRLMRLMDEPAEVVRGRLKSASLNQFEDDRRLVPSHALLPLDGPHKTSEPTSRSLWFQGHARGRPRGRVDGHRGRCLGCDARGTVRPRTAGVACAEEDVPSSYVPSPYPTAMTDVQALEEDGRLR